jgi:hypothetical protein
MAAWQGLEPKTKGNFFFFFLIGNKNFIASKKGARIKYTGSVLKSELNITQYNNPKTQEYKRKKISLKH